MTVEEQVEQALTMSRGTMVVGLHLDSPDDLEEARRLLKGRKGNALIQTALKSETLTGFPELVRGYKAAPGSTPAERADARHRQPTRPQDDDETTNQEPQKTKRAKKR